MHAHQAIIRYYLAVVKSLLPLLWPCRPSINRPQQIGTPKKKRKKLLRETDEDSLDTLRWAPIFADFKCKIIKKKSEKTSEAEASFDAIEMRWTKDLLLINCYGYMINCEELLLNGFTFNWTIECRLPVLRNCRSSSLLNHDCFERSLTNYSRKEKKVMTDCNCNLILQRYHVS